MDLDNINDIELLRAAAKLGRVRLKKDVDAYGKNGTRCTFKKGFWYPIEQEEHWIYIFSEDYNYRADFNYETTKIYLDR